MGGNRIEKDIPAQRYITHTKNATAQQHIVVSSITMIKPTGFIVIIINTILHYYYFIIILEKLENQTET